MLLKRFKYKLPKPLEVYKTPIAYIYFNAIFLSKKHSLQPYYKTIYAIPLLSNIRLKS